MIKITKYKNHKESTIGAYKYWHLIQYKENGYHYDCDMTNEGMMHLIDALKKAGNEIIFIEK
jgi:hypothetical protein